MNRCTGLADKEREPCFFCACKLFGVGETPLKRTFSISNVLAMVTLLGLAFAWIAAERRVVAERQAVVAKQVDAAIVERIAKAYSGGSWPPPSFPWVRRLLGDAPARIVYVSAATSDKDEYRLARLFPEAYVVRPSEVPFDFPPLDPRDPAQPWRALTLATAAFVAGYAAAVYWSKNHGTGA